MGMIIVEVEPGVQVRLSEEDAAKLGLKEYVKPMTPQKNKASKPAKAKKEEVAEELESEIDE